MSLPMTLGVGMLLGARHAVDADHLVVVATMIERERGLCGALRTAALWGSFMQGYRSKPKALAWSVDSTLLATSGESIVTIWDFGGKGPEGTEPIMLSAHVDLVTDLCFRQRGTLLASGAKDAGVIVWDPRKGTEPTAFAFLRQEISKIAFRPNHEQLAGIDASGAVACWALPTSRR